MSSPGSLSLDPTGRGWTELTERVHGPPSSGSPPPAAITRAGPGLSFRFDPAECATCPLRPDWTTATSGRTVFVGVHQSDPGRPSRRGRPPHPDPAAQPVLSGTQDRPFPRPGHAQSPLPGAPQNQTSSLPGRHRRQHQSPRPPRRPRRPLRTHPHRPGRLSPAVCWPHQHPTTHKQDSNPHPPTRKPIAANTVPPATGRPNIPKRALPAGSPRGCWIRRGSPRPRCSCPPTHTTQNRCRRSRPCRVRRCRAPPRPAATAPVSLERPTGSNQSSSDAERDAGTSGTPRFGLPGGCGRGNWAGLWVGVGLAGRDHVSAGFASRRRRPRAVPSRVRQRASVIRPPGGSRRKRVTLTVTDRHRGLGSQRCACW